MKFKFFFTIVFTLSAISIHLTAQEDSPSHRTRISFFSTQLSTGDILLSATLKARIGASYVDIGGESISFYTIGQEGEEVLLAEEIGSENGEALYQLAGDQIKMDTAGLMIFLARYGGSDTLQQSRDAELEIYRASLVVSQAEEDSVWYLRSALKQIKSEGEEPLEGIEVIAYVDRLFSELEIAREITDAQGEVQIEFPQDIPGDFEGNLQVKVRIEDDDLIGYLETPMTLRWGVPKTVVELENRTLWSPDPPLWMVVVFSLLMLVVWGHYVVVIVLLRRIRKLNIS